MIKQKYIDDFLNYLGNTKRCKKYGKSLGGRSLKNKYDICETSKNLYESGVPFQTGKQKYKKHVGNYLPVLDYISNKIYSYFNQNTNIIFDKFHQELCEYFVSELNKTRKVNGARPLTYGNAQKFINMLFKYLACFKDYRKFHKHFEFCHMPIDSIILDSDHLEKLGVGKVKNKKFDNCSWTQIDQKKYKQLVTEYRKIMQNPLQYDFENW